MLQLTSPYLVQMQTKGELFEYPKYSCRSWSFFDFVLVWFDPRKTNRDGGLGIFFYKESRPVGCYLHSKHSPYINQVDPFQGYSILNDQFYNLVL